MKGRAEEKLYLSTCIKLCCGLHLVKLAKTKNLSVSFCFLITDQLLFRYKSILLFRP